MAKHPASRIGLCLAVLAGISICLSALACDTSSVLFLATLTPTPTQIMPPPSEAASRETASPQFTLVDATQTAPPTVVPTRLGDTPAPSPTPAPPPQPTPDIGPTAVPTGTPAAAESSIPFAFADPVLTPVTHAGPDTTAVPTPVPVPFVAKNTINIVVLGSDRRPTWEDWHTDVVQVVSIQPSVPAVTVLSIPRDLYLYIPGFWMSRINFADMYGEIHDYPGGGPALMRQTLLYNLGIPVHLYVRTDFDGFIGIVDALGGVDIPVHCRLQDYWPERDASGVYPIKVMEPGYHHMDGDTALWYARSRKTTSVFCREERQQQVLYAIWRQARGAGFLTRIPELWQQLNDMIVTDIQLVDVLRLADVALRLDENDVSFRNIGAEYVIPWTTPYGGGVFLPRWDRIGPLVADVLAPVSEGRLDRAAQAVEVWNGTNRRDWDILAADRLLRQGYAAVIRAADHTDYARTTLIDFTTTSKGSALPHLQDMFGLSADDIVFAPDPDSPVRYRLIVGADYVTCPGS